MVACRYRVRGSPATSATASAAPPPAGEAGPELASRGVAVADNGEEATAAAAAAAAEQVVAAAGATLLPREASRAESSWLGAGLGLGLEPLP